MEALPELSPEDLGRMAGEAVAAVVAARPVGCKPYLEAIHNLRRLLSAGE